MKIAAIALASALAAIAGSAQPGLAQTANQNPDQSQYGQDQNRTELDQTGSRMSGSQSNMNGSMNDEDEDDENSYTTGQNADNPQRNQDGQNWSGEGNRNSDSNRGGSDRGRMEGRMSQRWHRHMMMGRNEGASFTFGNGNARMRIRCPANESLQNCVNAATQLLDKISSLKSNANLRGENQTNGQDMSGSTGMAPSEGANSTGGLGTQFVPSGQPGSTMPADSNGASASDKTDQQ